MTTLSCQLRVCKGVYACDDCVLKNKTVQVRSKPFRKDIRSDRISIFFFLSPSFTPTRLMISMFLLQQQSLPLGVLWLLLLLLLLQFIVPHLNLCFFSSFIAHKTTKILNFWRLYPPQGVDRILSALFCRHIKKVSNKKKMDF